MVHEWVHLPEGVVFCGESGSTDAIIVFRFEADGTTPPAPAEGSCDYSTGEDWVIAMKELGGVGNCRVLISGIGGFIRLIGSPDT